MGGLDPLARRLARLAHQRPYLRQNRTKEDYHVPGHHVPLGQCPADRREVRRLVSFLMKGSQLKLQAISSADDSWPA